MSTAFENHTIYQIPHDQRHGRIRDLFAVWFSTNLTLLTVVTGTLGTDLFGLSLPLAMLAIVLGNLVGGVVMALHAAQGPMLGVPQMVQSRGQFGSFGAMPIICLVVLMYIGFVASNFVVGGEALYTALPATGRTRAILLIALLSFVPCCMGYRIIHAWSKVVTWVAGSVILYCLWLGCTALPPGTMVDMHGSVAGFCSTFTAAALWQIAYAPYVSDSSRYLPANESGSRAAFLTTYAGSVTGTVLPMILGGMIGLLAHGAPVATVMARLAGAWATPVLVVLSLSIALGNAMSLYGGALSAITVIQTFMPDWRAALRERTLVTLLLVGAALAMGLGMADSFLKSYAAFLDLLMAVMVPWTAINLADYYLLRRGRYDIPSFFRQDGGVYGYCNLPALWAYAIGVAVELPFMQNGFHSGFLARALHGVDISWAVGLPVTTWLYVRAAPHRNRD
ncbi:purine-cytosine permease family protein [Komagataeibacter rhaeticus]|uniref:Cytosine permease n=1 Tax=Komagataeibacter rhaeticus TaxID=215221 RepID=A0A181C907_9PROT|nr:cytosine permease [Komagataeibacter rhaeticus]ATU72208.1 cytosine permease [Komagataeibacter xylinus]QIP34927.1 cytosine permease [Komagataeibacter rhaeticus]QOC47464.1 cytosine permease [Komagataeibacter rhaeticus]WPP21931.1 cytosine permease [Komagataeibacter rhaeticus]SAY48042.1 allantoin permease [Komagataeibacter rhaeticus]